MIKKIEPKTKKTGVSSKKTSAKSGAKPEPTILFENDNLAVINKPAGLVVHSDGKTDEPNLGDWLIKKYPANPKKGYAGIETVGEPARAPDGASFPRPGIVHRLDRETSGVMIVAKTAEAFAYLKEQFQNRLVHKTYNAFVWGIINESKGTVDRPIGRSKGDFRKWSAGRFARGEMRDAVTNFKVIGTKRFNDFLDAGIVLDKGDTEQDALREAKMTPAVSFVEVMPVTGRTHQIRVHMHFLHHPVVGDSLYAPNHPKILGFNRLALHARFIEFTDLDGKLIKIEAPLPADFKKAVKIFEKV